MAKRKTCGDCPKRDRYGTCLIRAKFVTQVHPACDFGRHEMQEAYMRNYQRKQTARSVAAATRKRKRRNGERNEVRNS